MLKVLDDRPSVLEPLRVDEAVALGNVVVQVVASSHEVRQATVDATREVVRFQVVDAQHVAAGLELLVVSPF